MASAVLHLDIQLSTNNKQDQPGATTTTTTTMTTLMTTTTNLLVEDAENLAQRAIERGQTARRPGTLVLRVHVLVQVLDHLL